MLGQRPGDRNKIYSLYEPHIYCIVKTRRTRKPFAQVGGAGGHEDVEGVVDGASAKEHSSRRNMFLM